MFVLQIGHRDFDVEKRLRRDLKRTHALLADLQLLLATMGDSGPPVDRGEIERVHIQVKTSNRIAHFQLVTLIEPET